MPLAAVHRRIAYDLREQVALRVAAADFHNVMAPRPQQIGGFVIVSPLVGDHAFA